jgi:hypothetical protein
VGLISQGDLAMASKSTKDADDDSALTDEERRAKLLKTGIGIGIGSAALVAALLYANSARKKKVDASDSD